MQLQQQVTDSTVYLCALQIWWLFDKVVTTFVASTEFYTWSSPVSTGMGEDFLIMFMVFLLNFERYTLFVNVNMLVSMWVIEDDHCY